LPQNVTAHACVQGDFLQTLLKGKTTVNVFLVNAAFLGVKWERDNYPTRERGMRPVR
jgi:sRNA-binding regulator protein Hfq